MKSLENSLPIEKGEGTDLYEGLGYCRYIRHLANDLAVVEAARVSYKSPSKGYEQDRKLLRYLLKHRHTSPFEQCSVTFNIKMPIFVMRQFVRHRTFRLNEWSGRYSELADDFYIPEKWRKQDDKNKQGSEDSEVLNHAACYLVAEEACKNAYSAYKALLKLGVAKEMARLVLPVSTMTEIFINVDLHNLMHFLVLRLDSHAQKEIQVLAQSMQEIAAKCFPETMSAFQELVLDAPSADELRAKFIEEAKRLREEAERDDATGEWVADSLISFAEEYNLTNG